MQLFLPAAGIGARLVLLPLLFLLCTCLADDEFAPPAGDFRQGKRRTTQSLNMQTIKNIVTSIAGEEVPAEAIKTMHNLVRNKVSATDRTGKGEDYGDDDDDNDDDNTVYGGGPSSPQRRKPPPPVDSSQGVPADPLSSYRERGRQVRDRVRQVPAEAVTKTQAVAETGLGKRENDDGDDDYYTGDDDYYAGDDDYGNGDDDDDDNVVHSDVSSSPQRREPPPPADSSEEFPADPLGPVDAREDMKRARDRVRQVTAEAVSKTQAVAEAGLGKGEDDDEDDDYGNDDDDDDDYGNDDDDDDDNAVHSDVSSPQRREPPPPVDSSEEVPADPLGSVYVEDIKREIVRNYERLHVGGGRNYANDIRMKPRQPHPRSIPTPKEIQQRDLYEKHDHLRNIPPINFTPDFVRDRLRRAGNDPADLEEDDFDHFADWKESDRERGFFDEYKKDTRVLSGRGDHQVLASFDARGNQILGVGEGVDGYVPSRPDLLAGVDDIRAEGMSLMWCAALCAADLRCLVAQFRRGKAIPPPDPDAGTSPLQYFSHTAGYRGTRWYSGAYGDVEDWGMYDTDYRWWYKLERSDDSYSAPGYYRNFRPDATSGKSRMVQIRELAEKHEREDDARYEGLGSENEPDDTPEGKLWDVTEFKETFQICRLFGREDGEEVHVQRFGGDDDETAVDFVSVTPEEARGGKQIWPSGVKEEGFDSIVLLARFVPRREKTCTDRGAANRDADEVKGVDLNHEELDLDDDANSGEELEAGKAGETDGSEEAEGTPEGDNKRPAAQKDKDSAPSPPLTNNVTGIPLLPPAHSPSAPIRVFIRPFVPVAGNNLEILTTSCPRWRSVPFKSLMNRKSSIHYADPSYSPPDRTVHLGQGNAYTISLWINPWSSPSEEKALNVTGHGIEGIVSASSTQIALGNMMDRDKEELVLPTMIFGPVNHGDSGPRVFFGLGRLAETLRHSVQMENEVPQPINRHVLAVRAHHMGHLGLTGIVSEEVKVGRWTHLALTMSSGGLLRGYVNGMFQGSMQYPMHVLPSLQGEMAAPRDIMKAPLYSKIVFGTGRDYPEMKGLIAGGTLWQRELSSEEVMQDLEETRPEELPEDWVWLARFAREAGLARQEAETKDEMELSSDNAAGDGDNDSDAAGQEIHLESESQDGESPPDVAEPAVGRDDGLRLESPSKRSKDFIEKKRSTPPPGENGILVDDVLLIVDWLRLAAATCRSGPLSYKFYNRLQPANATARSKPKILAASMEQCAPHVAPTKRHRLAHQLEMLAALALADVKKGRRVSSRPVEAMSMIALSLSWHIQNSHLDDDHGGGVDERTTAALPGYTDLEGSAGRNRQAYSYALTAAKAAVGFPQFWSVQDLPLERLDDEKFKRKKNSAEPKLDEVIQYRKTDSSSPRSQVMAGEALFHGGLGAEPNAAAARPHFQNVLDNNAPNMVPNIVRANALYHIGVMHANGQGGLPQNFPEGIRMIREAATIGYTPAMVSLGEQALHVDKNLTDAAGWFNLAAEMGSAQGKFQMYKLFFNGQGAPRKRRHAADLLAKAAALNNPSALQELAIILGDSGSWWSAIGNIVQLQGTYPEILRLDDVLTPMATNVAESIRLLRRVAAMGPWAHVAMKRGLKAYLADDLPKAAAAYEEAGSWGIHQGGDNAAWLEAVESGARTAEGREHAHLLHTRMAEQHSLSSIVWLGDYWYDKGNLTMARDLYRDASDVGFPKAVYSEAFMEFFGLGGSRNVSKSRDLLQWLQDNTEEGKLPGGFCLVGLRIWEILERPLSFTKQLIPLRVLKAVDNIMRHYLPGVGRY